MSALLADIRIAFMNLTEHRRRTAFILTAIAIVTCLFVLLASLSAGIRHSFVDTSTTLWTGHLNVGGYYKVTSGGAEMIIADSDKVAEVVKSSVTELDFTVRRLRGGAKIVSEQGASINSNISGIDIAVEPAFKSVLRILSGNVDNLAQPNTLLLFEKQAKKLDVKVGDAVTISAMTTRGTENTVDCQIVAIARDIGLLSSFNVYLSSDSLRTLYQLLPDITGVIQIHLKARYLNDLDPIAARLRQALKGAGYRVMEPNPQAINLKLQAVKGEDWIGQKLDVTTWQDEMSVLMWTFQALRGLNLVLVIVLLAIMIAGIMNTLWVAIRERTREIGTLRAIGMQRSGVARLFLIEACLLGVFGAVAGVLLGASLTTLINATNLRVPISVQLFLMRDTLILKLEPMTLVSVIVLITLVTGASALYPSLRAARRKPVDAMAHFG